MEGTEMNHKNSTYFELSGMSREQIIQLASKEVKRVLADVNLSHYHVIQVWKTSKAIGGISTISLSLKF